MTVRIGINGLGRTGRALLRGAHRGDLGLDDAAANELAAPTALARVCSRDSVFGRYDAQRTEAAACRARAPRK
jgi:glyceraldehyde 3-phosphate dehydrogenase